MSLQIELKKSAVSQKQPFPSDLAFGEIALNYHEDGPFLTCKDTAGNIRKINNVWVDSAPPTGPSPGDLWLDISVTPPLLKVYKDGVSQWTAATTVSVATTTTHGTVRLASSADVINGASGKVIDAAQLQSKMTAEIGSTFAFTIGGVETSTASGASVTISGGPIYDLYFTLPTQPLDLVAQSGNTYTLGGSDHGKVIKTTTSGTTTVVVPSGLPADFSCSIVQIASGTVTLSGGSGVSLFASSNSFKLAKQYSVVAVFAFDTDQYVVTGDLSI